jgi:hypothetical protein
MRVTAELLLPGRPRWALYDMERDLIHANIREPAQIVVINCDRTSIERALEVPSEARTGSGLTRGDCSAPRTAAHSSCSSETAARC